MPKAASVRVGVGSVLALATLLACSTNDESTMWSSAQGSSTSTGIGTGGSNSASNGGGVAISVGTSTGGGSTSTTSTAACADGSADCTCGTITVALLGKPGTYGDSDSTAFMNWLNSSSSGTAQVDQYLDRTDLTAEFLSQYNVIVLLGLGDDSDLGDANGNFWSYTESEVANLQSWVRAGGGLITLSGASSKDTEIDPQNQLLAFTGISYNTGTVSPECTIVDASGNKLCQNCTFNSTPIIDFVTSDDAIKGLSTGVTRIGMDWGRSINAPEDAHVAATIAAWNTFNVLVGKVVDSGRVLVYTDEWITYTNQWSAVAGVNGADCTDHLPQDVYQTAQFWYNMIKWVQPSAECFTIVDEEDTIVLW